MAKLPSLKEIGLEDRRVKIPQEIKDAIKEGLERGERVTHLARKYKVSVGTVYRIQDPERMKEMLKRERDARGGYKAYYKKEVHVQRCREYMKRKMTRINEIMEEYNKLKGGTNENTY